MTATATLEKPAASIVTAEERKRVHSAVCAYLKGYIVGYSSRHGMKWDGDVDRTPAFAKGWEDSKRRGHGTITFAHVIYNWLRHDRCHLGSELRDERFVKKFREDRAWSANPLLAALAELGLDIEEVLR